LSGTLLVLVSLPLGLRAPLLNAFVLPVLLLSRILLPMTLAPGWLQTVSDVNPLKHVVEGTREFFLGGYETQSRGGEPP
jgi:ABC-2 type transport system permease protein